MIQVPSKPYQIVLWTGVEHADTTPALRMEFDSLEEAVAEFEKQRETGLHRSGILYQWRRHSGSWDLLRRYPS